MSSNLQVLNFYLIGSEDNSGPHQPPQVQVFYEIGSVGLVWLDFNNRNESGSLVGNRDN